jgi:hypothetical protein
MMKLFSILTFDENGTELIFEAAAQTHAQAVDLVVEYVAFFQCGTSGGALDKELVSDPEEWLSLYDERGDLADSVFVREVILPVEPGLVDYTNGCEIALDPMASLKRRGVI